MAYARVEPFEFFTLDSLKAGWYLSWRLWLRLLGIYVGVAVLGVVVAISLGRAAGRGLLPILVIVAAVAIVASIYPVVVFTNRIVRGWALSYYGRELHSGVWWGIAWRSAMVSLAMSVGIGVAQFFFRGAFALVAHVASFTLVITQIVLNLQATGWAMSVMVARQLEGVEPAVTGASGVGTRPTSASPTSALTPDSEGRVQCPKCGQRETEFGQVIGWHCRICGWWESRG